MAMKLGFVLASKEKKYIIDNDKLMSEWHWEKNNELGLNPEKLTCGSGKKAWWICKEGHEWKSRIDHRNNKIGCPYCSGRFAISGVNDLQTLNPELAKEWHPTKNNQLTPNNVKCNYRKKVWWKCSYGHEWESSPNSRSQGTGCPYCSGYYTISGVNDLQTLNPELAKEWHPTKNDNLYPKDVKSNSNKKVWWVCKKGHEWKASIVNRNRGRGCPECSKEKQTSFPEQAIYFYCKKVTNAINRYTDLGKEIDVYLPEYNVGIEYNGSHWHKYKEQQDLDKIKYFKDNNIRIITVKGGNKNYVNGDVIEHNYRDKETLNFVIKNIFNLIGIPFKAIDINEDENEIINQYVILEKENSIASRNSQSIIEWDYEKNGKLLPTMVSHKSLKRVWWKCSKCGKSWQSSVCNYSGKGCKECSSKFSITKRCKQIRCVETNIIYNSISDAEKQTNICNIGSVCNGKRSVAGGYHWEFINENEKYKANKCRKKLECNKNIPKQVMCVETGDIYHSITYAEKQTNIKHIGETCNGKRKTAGGYHWEFIDDDEKN